MVKVENKVWIVYRHVSDGFTYSYDCLMGIFNSKDIAETMCLERYSTKELESIHIEEIELNILCDKLD